MLRPELAAIDRWQADFEPSMLQGIALLSERSPKSFQTPLLMLLDLNNRRMLSAPAFSLAVKNLFLNAVDKAIQRLVAIKRRDALAIVVQAVDEEIRVLASARNAIEANLGGAVVAHDSARLG